MNCKSIFIILLLTIISSCDLGEKSAKNNFEESYSKILKAIEFHKTHPGIYYIEFTSDTTIDLTVLDKDSLKEKYRLFNKHIDSKETREALAYAKYDLEDLVQLRDLLFKANCISIQMPFNDPFEIFRVGYQRKFLSKWYYIKIKNSIDVEKLINGWPYEKQGAHKIKDNWILVLSPPAFG